MMPQPAKEQPDVARGHPRESSRYGTATHMQGAHAPRGRRGGSRDRPRQLQLAQRLVRAARALQWPSRSRWPSALLETVRMKGSGRGHGRPRPRECRNNRPNRPVVPTPAGLVRDHHIAHARGVAARIRLCRNIDPHLSNYVNIENWRPAQQLLTIY